MKWLFLPLVLLGQVPVQVPEFTIVSLGLPPGALAMTWCEFGVPRTAIDATLVGGPLETEVMVHEAYHRRQFRRRQAQAHLPPDVCPPRMTTDQLLHEEIEAYCASLPFRVKRGETPEEARGHYAAMLVNQFYGRVMPANVVAEWLRGCPATTAP